MENSNHLRILTGAQPPADSAAVTDPARRAFLRALGLQLTCCMIPSAGLDAFRRESAGSGQKIVVVIFGGVRGAETFSAGGLENIPHLSHDLLPKSIFYTRIRNEGVTAHFNAISSILTGNWQRVDDWGKLPPSTPTVFENFRKQLGAPQSDTWIVASNKALTSQIGASSASEYGPAFGANVVFPKQLMIMAVADALRRGQTANMADREKIEAEFECALEGSNYEGLGWNVFDAADRLNPRVRGMVNDAIADFVRGGPTSGDELTFLVSREVMRRFAPSLLVTVFSDVEVAHFGSYALHVAGIRTGDRLAFELWQEIESNPEYHGKTTLIILPEFGRDPDGSTTNGFFNHRANEEPTRTTWLMALGAGIGKPEVIERPIRHIDLCPTISRMLGCRPIDSQGNRLLELLG